MISDMLAKNTWQIPQAPQADTKEDYPHHWK